MKGVVIPEVVDYVGDVDAIPENREESPKRAKWRAEAAKTARRQGTKRIQKYLEKNKSALDEGDVVRIVIKKKNRSPVGDKLLLGTVFQKHRGGRYVVLTHAGLVSDKYARNDLQYDDKMTANFLGIDPRLGLLPPVSEFIALRLICPDRVSGMSCNCAKVKGGRE
jgi:hypothetical protein